MTVCTNNLCTDFLVGLGTNFVATILGIAFVFLVWDGVINRRRFSGWVVRVRYKEREVMPERLISWRKAKEIADDDAHRSVFLKGVASPFARFSCDIITEGEYKELLLIEHIPKWGFGERRIYTFDLTKGEEQKLLTIEKTVIERVFAEEPLDDSQPSLQLPAPPSPVVEPVAAAPTLLLNFAHPLTADHLAAIKQLAGQPVVEVRDEPTQTTIDLARPLGDQARAIVDNFGLSPDEWQTRAILIIPPAYAPATAAVMAELHGRMGDFPIIVRLRPVTGSSPTRYEVAEIVNLKKMRDAGRESRHRR